MDYIWTHWSVLMDLAAKEWVERLGSILAGYVAFSMLFVPVMTVSGLVSRLRGNWWKAVFIAGILFCIVVGVVVMFQVHGIWNSYQHWYLTPGDPNWQPVTPGYRYGPSG